MGGTALAQEPSSAVTVRLCADSWPVWPAPRQFSWGNGEPVVSTITPRPLPAPKPVAAAVSEGPVELLLSLAEAF